MKVGFTTITVRNLEKSVTFYTKILKLHELQRFSPHKGIKIVFLRDKENGKIELIEYEQMKEIDVSKKASIVSIGFVVEDLDATINMLRKKNVEIIRGPIQTPSGAKFIFISDPDGVEIELIQDFDI